MGVTSVNARETVLKMKMVEELGGTGVLVGVPYYFPSSLANAVRFFRELATMFPRLGIMIYHNPALHHVRIPVEAFPDLIDCPNIVAMKDSHRDPVEFIRPQKITAGKIAVFCFQGQYFQYADLGAPGFWSIDAWLGPWPLLALRDAGVCRVTVPGRRNGLRGVRAEVSSPELRCQRIEILRSGERAPVIAPQLPFADHVHDLDAAKDDAGTAEGFESEHRSSDALDRPVVLLNDVVEPAFTR